MVTCYAGVKLLYLLISQHQKRSRLVSTAVFLMSLRRAPFLLIAIIFCHDSAFLPRLSFPPTSDVKMWSDVNDWVQFAVVPKVLEAVGVESKYQVIPERLYYGLKSRKRKRKPANNQAQLDALRSTKNEVRCKFRQAKRQGASLAELTPFARQFHQLIRRHSKLKAVMNKRDLKSSARNANKRCSTNFWKFSKDLFSDDSDTSNVLPVFC
ncbi:uncharacterized protein LOC134195403 [Corticium candelabrum]|uniref:uncharacterized protein LOC134195403 n=1 Tax=Corticium candelabrum TaxID=121492 RepID=UPI002E259795|nr:uncharacterized protein LOC134195403 [Corticium candelabrum]